MMTLMLLSQKGGAGRSTLALHLASEASKNGLRVLLMDLDPQGNLLAWGRRRGELPPDVQAEHLANLESALADGYDLVVLDTSPAADRGAMLAASCADLIVVPCRPATFDLEAIRATLEVAELKKRRAIVVLN